jgi:hypothetical protein
LPFSRLYDKKWGNYSELDISMIPNTSSITGPRKPFAYGENGLKIEAI